MTVASNAPSFRLPRWASIVFGLLSVAAGVAALVWPGITILVLVSLLGIQILLYGAFAVVVAFRTGEARILAVIFGVLSLLAGTALWLRPLRNLGAVLVVLAVFWIVGGLVQTIGAIIERDEGWGWDLVSGLVSVGAGIVVIAWPSITLFVIAVTAGIWMIVIGVVWVISAFGAREVAAV